jgi:histidinol-phosphate aminotransferase
MIYPDRKFKGRDQVSFLEDSMEKSVKEFFVPWIRDQKMYISPHIELAWQKPGLHRMMSNENPHEPSLRVQEAIQNYAKMANRYPDQGLVVRSKIAEINGLDGPENVLLGNGSSEIYDMIWRSFVEVGQEVIQHTPCFGIYKLRCAVVGGKLVSVPMLYEGGKLLFDPDAVIAAISPKTKIVVIANPNNPTGNFMASEDFVRIAETGIPFVIDEAYVEYAGLQKSQVRLIKTFENVIITRTLSKAYALAGLRFGYAIGNKGVIDILAATLLPWNVGTIPMWAALAALGDTESLQRRVAFNNEQVKFIEESLSDIPGLTIFNSRGNYILFDGGQAGKPGNAMVDFALTKGLIFRPQSSMYGSDGWFRVTIGTAEENQLAVDAIREFFTQ